MNRGSLTVEAALLMPFVLYVIVFILYAGFYWYDAAVCAQICFEGSRNLAVGSSADLTAQETVLRNKTFGLTNMKIESDEQSDRVTVTVEAELEAPYVGIRFSIREEQWAYVLDQRAFIRKASTIMELLQ